MIQYIDGKGFFLAFIYGAENLIKNREYLNRINVFPVADADTGTNMASTLSSIIEGTEPARSLKSTLQSMADSGLSGARGNSGIIFTQYLLGISLELDDSLRVTAQSFSESAVKAIKHVYDSLVEPVEGTMLTVIKDWADALLKQSNKTNDVYELLQDAYREALSSLEKTPAKLKVLADAKVVDAGAKAFVYLLEGILEYLKKGNYQLREMKLTKLPEDELKDAHTDHTTGVRYCTEAVIGKPSLSLAEFKEKFRSYGQSFIVAGTTEKIHLHIHTDDPARFFFDVKDYGLILNIKVDDMLMQYLISHQRKFPLGIVTDSACDLPLELLEKYQIQRLSFGINFGENIFLDQKTILPEQFYSMLKMEKVHPVSSQPSPKHIEYLLEFMSNHYQRVYAVHISKELTGIYQTAQKYATKFTNIKAVNTRHLSVSQGLIVLRIAEAISSGMSAAEVDENLDTWINKAHILTDVNTLKYLVRGGRVSPFKGIIAKALNLKPILSVDKQGKAKAYGKSFSRKDNMKKITAAIADMAKDNDIWKYAIVHADALDRALIYQDKLTTALGKEPAFVMPLSPVLGVHNGIGAVAIGIMIK
jgi:hypothetical protein